MPPNSLAVVWAARTAPLRRRRAMEVWSSEETRSLKIIEASV